MACPDAVRCDDCIPGVYDGAYCLVDWAFEPWELWVDEGGQG